MNKTKMQFLEKFVKKCHINTVDFVNFFNSVQGRQGSNNRYVLTSQQQTNTVVHLLGKEKN